MSDSEQKVLFVFPGQGSQYPGMGRDLFDEYAVARDVYQQAGEVLGFDIAKLSFEDSRDQLNLTRYTQPALLTHSIACLKIFRDLTGDRLQPVTAAGHSLGEYSALVAAGVLDFPGALKLVQKRGQLMGDHGEGEMTALPLDLDTVRPIAERFHCAVAGCNLPQQTVIGGRCDDLERAEQAVQERFPRKRPVRLKTEGAFHTYYMVGAARHYRSVLETAGFATTDVRVLSNFTGGYHTSDPDDIRAGLFFQLFHPVMWYSNLQAALADGCNTIVEFGGGIGTATEPDGKRPNLEGMIKKSLRGTGYEVNYHSVINSRTLGDAVSAFCGR